MSEVTGPIDGSVEVEGADLALEEAVAVAGESADGCHGVISCLSLKAGRPTLMEIDRPGAGDRPVKVEAQRRTAGTRLF